MKTKRPEPKFENLKWYVNDVKIDYGEDRPYSLSPLIEPTAEVVLRAPINSEVGNFTLNELYVHIHNNLDSKTIRCNKGAIKKVIFNDPATIIFWYDGDKTVVKAENEPYDPEKGMAMAIAKKSLGNKGNYFNEFKKWLPERGDK